MQVGGKNGAIMQVTTYSIRLSNIRGHEETKQLCGSRTIKDATFGWPGIVEWCIVIILAVF